MMLYKDIEAWVTKKVTGMGGLSLKFVSLGNAGVPNRIYIFPEGRIYFAELKKNTDGCKASRNGSVKDS